jgi:hypothetical protein
MSDDEILALIKRISDGFDKAAAAIHDATECYRTFNETLAKYQG